MSFLAPLAARLGAGAAAEGAGGAAGGALGRGATTRFGARALGMNMMRHNQERPATAQPNPNMVQDFSNVMQPGQFG